MNSTYSKPVKRSLKYIISQLKEDKQAAEIKIMHLERELQNTKLELSSRLQSVDSAPSFQDIVHDFNSKEIVNELKSCQSRVSKFYILFLACCVKCKYRKNNAL